MMYTFFIYISIGNNISQYKWFVSNCKWFVVVSNASDLSPLMLVICLNASDLSPVASDLYPITNI